MSSITKRLVRSGLIAALYVSLCMLFAPISYGPVQVRISEALTLLPFLTPDAVLGVTLGCFLANALTFSPVDMLFGTLATFIAALLTAWLGKRNRALGAAPTTRTLVLAALPPTLLNAVIVGWEITLFFSDTPATMALFLANGTSVGLGQIISCGVLGVLLVRTILRNPALCTFFEVNTHSQHVHTL